MACAHLGLVNMGDPEECRDQWECRGCKDQWGCRGQAWAQCLDLGMEELQEVLGHRGMECSKA